jgi:hypothetical protein
LYTYICTGMVAVFGNSLLAFRILGALLFVFIAVIVYLIFKEFVPSWIAATGAVLAAFAFQTDVFYISYDYHSFCMAFTLLICFFILRTIIRKYQGKELNTNLNMLAAGIACALVTLFRPQSGVMIFAFLIISFIFMHISLKTIKFNYKEMCCFLIGIVVPILITGMLLVSVDAFGPCVEMVFFGGTKGDVISMLFGWVPRLMRAVIFPALILIPYLVLVIFKERSAELYNDKKNLVLFFVMVLVLAVVIVALFTSLSLSSGVFNLYFQWQNTMFLLGSTIFLALLIKVIRSSRRNEPLSDFDLFGSFFGGFAFVVSWTIATSGGDSNCGNALFFGFLIVTLLYYSVELPQITKKDVIRIFSLSFVIFLVATSVSSKVMEPHYWWGDTVTPYPLCTYETDIDYFHGIGMSSDDKYMYEDFVNNANMFLGLDDELYCYANISVFYTLANKVPSVKSPVPWFDVSRSATIYEDLEYLKLNNPKMIIFSDHTMEVLELHEELYGGKPAHRELYNWLLDCKSGANGYSVIATYNGSFVIYLMVR